MTITLTNWLHQINISIHIACGCLALLFGCFAILISKRSTLHQKSGKLFLCFLLVVILTGLIAVFFFQRNTFLLVITVLSGYLGYSGYRTLQTKSNLPKTPDIVIALLSLASLGYFLYYFKRSGMIWDPMIIYSTMGYLILIVSYDLGRYFIPKSRYGKLWLYEHILKMISAFSAILSAFTGTVFAQYHPYSQFLPSILGAMVATAFMLVTYHKNRQATT
ncbi:hypothetical protein [Pedobacter gandavensis]|uniref:DUF2306 domain-containing protein n=1 Tax=Pedobacter gandavensis TaxID=2679963 RepID=A0ABR6ERN1_9SPHI|nr:hypothetical protein [Pedobacter gandavensis]MBB2147920.1 hypothetical protein [Pedobacter gandavensis]